MNGQLTHNVCLDSVHQTPPIQPRPSIVKDRLVSNALVTLIVLLIFVEVMGCAKHIHLAKLAVAQMYAIVLLINFALTDFVNMLRDLNRLNVQVTMIANLDSVQGKNTHPISMINLQLKFSRMQC